MKRTRYFKRTGEGAIHGSNASGLLFLLKYYLTFIILSAIYKILFLALNSGNDSFSFGDYTDVLQHGTKHDFAVAGYFTAIPLLLTMANTFMRLPLRYFYKAYNGIMAFATSLALCVGLQVEEIVIRALQNGFCNKETTVPDIGSESG